MKKFLSSLLAVLMIATAFSVTMGFSVSAAEKSILFSEINKGGVNGFVDRKPSAKAEVVEVDGIKALKVTMDPSAEYTNTLINLEGHGFSKLGISYDTYRYMSIEYKYVTKKQVYNGPFAIQLCNSNKVFESGGGVVNGTTLTASGKWETAYFDLVPLVDGRLSTSKDDHTINHIQVRPFGGTPAKTLDAADEIYIGKITFSESNLQPGGTTAAPVVPEKPEVVETPTATTTPESLGGSTKGAQPKVMGEGALKAPATKVLVSTVDKKDTGLYEKVKADGRDLVKFTPNPSGKDSGTAVALDAHAMANGAFGKVPTYEEISFITVEYFYAAKNPTHKDALEIQLANSNKVFQNGGKRLKSSNPMIAGEWDVAYFHITEAIKATLKTDMTEHVLKHIQFLPFGDKKASSLTADDVLYVGDIILHKTNPNPKVEYTFTFKKNGFGVTGDDVASITVKKGESYTLPECTWTYAGFVFKGWDVNNKAYKPGDSVTAEGDEDYIVAAVWEEAAETSTSSKAFNYADNINSGVIVDFVGAVTAEKVVEDSIPAVKATPVPDFRKDGKATNLGLDNFSLNNKLRINLDEYKYATVTYKYVSPNPLTDVVKIPYLNLTRNSGLFTKGGLPFKAIENTELRVNEWATVLYEFPNLEGAYANPDSSDRLLRQFHIQPFGAGVTNDKLTVDDVVYIQAMTFHKEKPEKAEIALPYITGFEDGSFGLGKSMTRAQACTVVARLIAGGDANVPAGTSAFTDVTANDWFAKYVAYCEAKGLLKSYSGTFAPNQNITRAEFVELVYNMGLLLDAGKNGTFTDVPADHARAEVISAAGKAGLVNGYDNGDGTFSFKPDNTISREEVVTVINNAYGRKSDKKYLDSCGYGLYFTDVKSDHWAFPAIIDASVMHFACREVGAETDTWLYKLELQDVNDEESSAAALAKVQEVDALTDKRIAEIRNTKTTVEAKGTKYYFAADGDDANDGLSPEKPKKTLAAVNMLPLKAGDGVYFKRGDIFRGQISAKSGVTYTAYGEGEKPKLYASPANFAGAENWEQTSVPNVWKLKTPITHDVGLVVFNEGEAWTEKRIKGRPDFKDGGLENLDKDLTMWHDVAAPNDVAGYVYVRCDKGNPGAIYNSIELNPRAHIIKVSANDVTIDNLCIKYTGAHGVSSGGVKNLVVTNCEFGFIGGSWFRTDTLSRYGNAVEIYGAVDGYVVDNCYIYHCYDAGVTHQLTQSPEKECIMADIHYTNNVITYTSYPVEYFINEPNAGVTHAYLGLEISDNIIRYTGYGFGDQRPDKTAAAGIKSWNTYNAADNYVMNNNIFDRSKYNLIQLGAFAAAWMPKMDGNTYIIEEGGEFGNIGDTDGGTAVTAIALQKYVEANSKDKNAKVYVLKKAQ